MLISQTIPPKDCKGVIDLRPGRADERRRELRIPDPVIDAIEDGTPAVKAFRQSAGLSQHVVAVAGMTDERLAETERGHTPKDLELAVISDALHVPVDLLVDE